MKQVFSIKNLSEMTGVSPNTIAKHIKSGICPAEKLGTGKKGKVSFWMVTEQGLDIYYEFLTTKFKPRCVEKCLDCY